MYRLIVSILVLIVVNSVSAQPSPTPLPDTLLTKLPADLQLKEPGPQRYQFATDYVYLDPTGNVTGKDRVSADYTRGLPDGKVRWDHVEIAKAKTYDQPFPQGVPQRFMDGFSYKLNNLGDTFKKDFFNGFPDDMQPKTLVWDVHMFEAFAWNYLDKLKPNEPFRLDLPDAQFPQGGHFHNRQPELIWIGVSQKNGKTCALIQYEVFFNQLSFVTNGLPLNARSHYWGIIWLSLEDKQLEYATLREDVLGKLEIPGPAGKQEIIVNTFRVGTFQRKQ